MLANLHESIVPIREELARLLGRHPQTTASTLAAQLCKLRRATVSGRLRVILQNPSGVHQPRKTAGRKRVRCDELPTLSQRLDSSCLPDLESDERDGGPIESAIDVHVGIPGTGSDFNAVEQRAEICSSFYVPPSNVQTRVGDCSRTQENDGNLLTRSAHMSSLCLSSLWKANAAVACPYHGLAS